MELSLSEPRPAFRALTWTLGICLFTALTAVAAHIRIPLPFTPVPVTAQSLIVVLSGVYLGSLRGALSQLLLIVLGAAGFAVFTNTATGWQVLLGPTGGYILGFVFCAYVAGAMKEKRVLKSWLSTYLYLFAASFFIFVPGVIWLKIMLQIEWMQAVTLGFLPFLLGDIVKTFLATLSYGIGPAN